MKLLILFDHRFQVGPDGLPRSNGAYSYEYFRDRYLTVFDEVSVMARVDPSQTVESADRVSGAGVKVIPAPFWSGPFELVRQSRSIRATVHSTLNHAEAVICVAPGVLSGQAHSALKSQRHPYGVEVAGDPRGALAKGSVRIPARPFVRVHAIRQLRSLVSDAAAVSYVTQSTLQHFYPSGAEAISVAVSDVELPDIAPSFRVDVHKGDRDVKRLVFIGSFSQMYKAPDVLLHAFTAVARQFQGDLEMVMIGEGYYRAEMMNLAGRLGISNQVRFTGSLTRSQVISELDCADLFILPSRTEGLPRAMVEAMARGLPCIGSRVGGIPELLNDRFLVEPGNARDLENKILEVIQSPPLLSEMSRMNLARAGEFEAAVLLERRLQFQNHLKEVTQAWLISNSRS